MSGSIFVPCGFILRRVFRLGLTRAQCKAFAREHDMESSAVFSAATANAALCEKIFKKHPLQ